MTCTYCYKGFVLPGEPKGSIVGQDYSTAAPSDATQRTKAIILLTDIFGLPLPNPRIVADHLAEHVGVDVWIPDFFNGAPSHYYRCLWLADIQTPLRSGKPPFDVNKLEPLMPDRAGVKISLRDVALFIVKGLPSLPRFFLNRPSVVDPRVHKASVPSPYALFRRTRALIIQFVKKIKSEKGYERIGAVGFALVANARSAPRLMSFWLDTVLAAAWLVVWVPLTL
jgi:hypothetical protein